MSDMTWSAIYDALQVVSEADLDKARLIEEAAKEEAKTRLEAARMEGLAKGQQEGREAVLKNFENAIAAWSKGVIEFDRSLKMRVQSESAVVLQAAALLAYRVLQAEFRQPSALEQHLNDILLEDQPEQSVAIFVSPADRETITNSRFRIPAIEKARIEVDSSLGGGDLRIEYKNHLVDARLWIMLKRGVDVLREAASK